jgi:hypothetical protein
MNKTFSVDYYRGLPFRRFPPEPVEGGSSTGVPSHGSALAGSFRLPEEDLTSNLDGVRSDDQNCLSTLNSHDLLLNSADLSFLITPFISKLQD